MVIVRKEDFIKLGLSEELAIQCAYYSKEELKGYIPKIRFDEVNNEKKKLKKIVEETRNSNVRYSKCDKQSQRITIDIASL